jgi:OOP family OmpA-OmpF porin
MSKQLFLYAVLLAAGAVQARQLPNAPGARLSDQAIALDKQQYAALQGRIERLNSKGVPVADYYLSKAQCWLDVSLHEYTRNDRSAFPAEAYGQGVRIVAALESGQASNPGEQTPLVNGATRLREDLWARFAALRSAPGAQCAAQQVACGEVELVHAGNEYAQQGWRHANPYIQIAEQKVRDAQAAAEQCAAVPPPAAPAMCTPAPAQACAPAPAPAPAPVVDKITLAADALFAFDKSALADLLPAGRARIDEMMRQLNQGYARIDSIRLVGYTDRLGGTAYNQALSERRAATVRQYLLLKGYTGEIASSGQGKAGQLKACTGVAPREALIACLQPNRRVEIEVSGVKRGAATPQ